MLLSTWQGAYAVGLRGSKSWLTIAGTRAWSEPSAATYNLISFCRLLYYRIVPLYREGEIDQEVFKYINR